MGIKGLLLKDTEKMSEKSLQVEIGKHYKLLEELGMNHDDAVNFITSVLNLGASMQRKFDDAKRK